MKGFTKTLDGVVIPEWLDVNGHMNVAHYMAAFDAAMFELLERMGIDQAAIAAGSPTLVGSRINIAHRKELLEGDHFEVWSGIVGIGNRAMTVVQRMTSNKAIRATCNILAVPFSLETRCAVAVTPEMQKSARAFVIEGITDPFPDLKV